ncbi:MAG: peptidoglycan-binding protein [Candidatus Sungbacteria bacterium]|nr:peptidoglycan-binding protein [Candidatus Sungbacteria bacterium]
MSDAVQEVPRFMNQGSRGAAVQRYQEALVEKGLSVSSFVPDGIYGQVHAAIVGALQAKHGIKPDGHTGPMTWAMLKAEYDIDVDDIIRTTPGKTTLVQDDGTTIEWDDIVAG